MNILKHVHLPRDTTCLIALSGGGDSVALLDLTCTLARKRKLVLYAAKVRHGVRTESEEDAEVRLCRNLCNERNIPFSVLENNATTIAGIQERFTCGPEQAARNFRQQLLHKHMEEMGTEHLLLGHTADDNLETIFMRLLSGSGIEGLAGIRRRKGVSLRPLLEISRSELRRYLLSRHIPWIEDRTNSENTYRRNRLRNELIPMIFQIFPGWGTSLRTLGERSAEAADSLKHLASVHIPCIKTEHDCCWRESDWDASPEYLTALALWEAFDYLDHSGIPDRRLSWKSIKEARKQISAHRVWNSQGMRLERTDGNVKMSRQDERGLMCGRILLDQNDVRNNFSTVLGGVIVKVSFQRAAGWKEMTMFPSEWPVELHFNGTWYTSDCEDCPMTEQKAGNKFPDSHRELVYILIKRLEEGIYVGKQEQQQFQI